MKKVQVYITATVVGTITVPDNTTDEDIKNGFADIYFYPANMPHIEKEDLGADQFTVEILPKEIEVTKERIVNFYKKYFTELKEHLMNGEEFILIPDNTYTEEDNEVISYLEYNCISYSNEEILEMINS